MMEWECPNCNSDKLLLGHTLKGQVQDGRHRLNEISVTVWLGCEDCGETVDSMTIEEFLAMLMAEDA